MKRRNDNSALAEIFNDPGEMAEIEQGASLLLGGIQLGEIRKRLGLSQAAVAERMGVSQRRISAIENGKPGSAQVSTLAAYAEALNGHLDVSIEVGDQQLVVARLGTSEREESDAIEHREEARLAYELAEWARARRKLLGLSQSDVAARSGLTRPALSKLEGGRIILGLDLYLRVIRALTDDCIPRNELIESWRQQKPSSRRPRFLATLDVQAPHTGRLLKTTLASLAGELEGLRDTDPTINAVDMKFSLDTGRVTVHMLVEADTAESAGVYAGSTLRTAIHAIGGATPSWGGAETVQGLSTRRESLIGL